MTYTAEFNFLQSAMQKIRMNVQLLDVAELSEYSLQSDLRLFLEDESGHDLEMKKYLQMAKHGTMYRYRDSYEWLYLFFLLPEMGRETVLLIGPYLDRDMSREDILELGERLSVPPRKIRLMQQHYSMLPSVQDESLLFAILDTFADRIWGSSEYSLVDLNREFPGTTRIRDENNTVGPEETQWRMKMQEQRYASENEMMYAVAHGMTHKVETMFSHFNQLALEQRMADPVRNLKNYALVMNTLLRKAAEQGGVHPVYLDETSSDYSKRIEQMNSVDSVVKLMSEIGPGYCRLVNKHAKKRHSQLVQRVIASVDADLTADLSLRALAESFRVSSSYLSTLFKKETGLTVTEYVNKARMDFAMRLLGTTKLQVQTIAQHCGILDVNYFSKLFKKHVGLSPMEWRRSTLPHKPI